MFLRASSELPDIDGYKTEHHSVHILPLIPPLIKEGFIFQIFVYYCEEVAAPLFVAAPQSLSGAGTAEPHGWRVWRYLIKAVQCLDARATGATGLV